MVSGEAWCIYCKSAYSLLQQAKEGQRSVAESSHARDTSRKMWQKVWKLSVKTKLKHFLWKSIHGWLPTNEAIRKKGVQCDTICKRCGLGSESREHLFFHCPASMFIWKLAPISWEKFSHLTGNFVDWWNQICAADRDHSVQKGVEFSVYLLWHIWKARNLWQFQNHLLLTEEVVFNALKEWQEYADSQGMAWNCEQREGSSGMSQDESYVINVASEFMNAVQGAGMGMIIRDAKDKIVLAQAECCMNFQTQCMAEMEIVRRALWEAQSRNMQRIEIRLDVKIMVTWLQGKTPPVTEVISIVEDIFLVKSKFESCRFIFIHRNWNVGSHYLAHLAFSSRDPQRWEGEIPQWLEKFL